MPGTDKQILIVDDEPALLKRSEEHTSELQSPCNLECRLPLEKKTKRIRSSAKDTASPCTRLPLHSQPPTPPRTNAFRQSTNRQRRLPTPTPAAEATRTAASSS